MSNYMTIEDAKQILQKNCRSLEKSDIDIADFKFKNAVDALVMISFTKSYIPLERQLALKVKDIGSGDVSSRFEQQMLLGLLGEEGWPSYAGFLMPFNWMPHEFFKSFPEYLSKKPYLAFVKDEAETIEKVIEEGYEPTDFVFYKVGGDSIGEDFFEWMAGLHFKERGYFVSKWHPFTGSDLFAYKIPEYQRELSRRGYIGAGAFTFELALIPLVKQKQIPFTAEGYDTVIIEAESRYNLATRGSWTGLGQIRGKQSVSTCEIYGVGPTTQESINDQDRENFVRLFGKRAGAILFTKEGKKLVYEPQEQGFQKEDEVIERVKVMIKSIIAASIALPRLKKVLGVSKVADLSRKLIEIELSELLDLVESE